MCGFLGVGFFRSLESTVLEGNRFGILDSINYEASSRMTPHAVILAPAAAVGLVTGFMAIIFTIANIQICKLRAVYAPVKKPLNRIIEPLVIMFAYATICAFLPLAFPCVPTTCFVDKLSEEIICPIETTPDLRRVVEVSVQPYTCKQNSTDPSSDFHVVREPCHSRRSS
jgi:chloride channel 7